MICLTAFKKAALPFLDLDGQQVPETLHLEFDQIDTTVRNEIFPAMEILQEEWDTLSATQTPAISQPVQFASMCADLIRTIELEIIPLTSHMDRNLCPTIP